MKTFNEMLENQRNLQESVIDDIVESNKGRKIGDVALDHKGKEVVGSTILNIDDWTIVCSLVKGSSVKIFEYNTIKKSQINIDFDKSSLKFIK